MAKIGQVQVGIQTKSDCVQFKTMLNCINFNQNERFMAVLGDFKVHPCLKHHEMIKDICRPLKSLGVHFFGYTAVDSMNNGYCLGSRANYAEEYLRKKHVKNDLNYRDDKPKSKKDYDFWDFQELDSNKKDLYQMAAEFDQGHTLSITKHEIDMTHSFHFSGQLADEGFNQRLLEKMDTLHAFMDLFSHQLNNIPELNEIYNHPERIANPVSSENRTISLIDIDPRSFIIDHKARHTINFKSESKYLLTANERDCLKWLIKGKSAEMIAEINQISRKTVERYISSLKEKFQCYTLFQLGQRVAEQGLAEFL